jgi:hypothetical protein
MEVGNEQAWNAELLVYTDYSSTPSSTEVPEDSVVE